MASTVAVVLSAFAVPALAQDPAPLFVEFELGDYPQAAGPFDAADVAAIAGQLAEAAQKQGELPYWTFRAAVAASDHPRLTVTIHEEDETGDFDLVATLHLAPGDAGHGTWDGRFLTLGQLLEDGGFPARSRLPSLVVQAFSENVLTQARVSTLDGEMFEVLSRLVPVADKAHLEADHLRGSVGIDRSRYGLLALSTFRLLCAKANGTVIWLYSEGTGQQEEFPDPRFPAIVVEHRGWQEGGAERLPLSSEHLAALDDLSLTGIYLDEFDVTGLLQSAAGGQPPPSLAPSPAGTGGTR